MIDKDKAEALIKKYCPSVTLTIANREGREGVYLTIPNEIVITKDWTITGLLHEMTHAILYLKERRTGHDGVFADLFTKLVAETFEEDKMTPEEINYFNLNQSPNTFKVDKTGLYKTRNGKKAFVSAAPSYIVAGVIEGDSRLYNWIEDGSRSKGKLSEEDLVEKWKD